MAEIIHYVDLVMDSLNQLQNIKNFGLSVALCLVLIGLDFSIGLKPIRGILESIFILPLTKIEQALMIVHEPYKLYVQLNQGRQRISELETLLATQAVDREKLKNLTIENDFLRTLAQVSKKKPRVIAWLSVHGNATWLNAGFQDEIHKGMWVLSENGAIIGRVEKIGRNVSMVETLRSISFKLPGANSQGTASGIIEGDGIATFLTNISQGDQIAIGDLVLSSGAQDDIPSKIPVGIVSEIVGSESQVIKKARLELLAQPKTGMMVSIE